MKKNKNSTVIAISIVRSSLFALVLTVWIAYAIIVWGHWGKTKEEIAPSLDVDQLELAEEKKAGTVSPFL